jgi:hypothetical protein
MTTAGPRTFLLCGLLVGCFSSGCAFSGDHRILRLWADYNTLKTPALFIEETDHLPYHASRVKHYRWMYNANYGQQHVGLTVYPAGIAAPVGQTGQPIETPVPAQGKPMHAPQKMPSTELPRYHRRSRPISIRLTENPQSRSQSRYRFPSNQLFPTGRPPPVIG